MKCDDMMMMVTNLYSSMITASCSSTVSRLCGSKPSVSIGFLIILACLGQISFLGDKNKFWLVSAKHL